MTTAATTVPVAAVDPPAPTPMGTMPPHVVPIDDIVPSPLNPRAHFDVAELTDSVRTHGVLMPLLTRPRKGKYEIVEGERRYRAAKAAGVLFLEVKSRDLSDADALEIMLLANGQREDLTPLEQARGYKRLIEKNPSKYSIAFIAQRISRSEKFVADRMRLLELIEPLQQLLDRERILVGHAELLAKLKPEDQARALAPTDGGLWDHEGSTLDFDTLTDERDREADPYDGCKPRTVRELEAWIARHIRFDVEHFATTAPLDFGATAAAVELAEAKEGRGKKVISLTADSFVQPDAKTKDGDRIFGPRSWKRADGSTGTSTDGRGKAIDSPVCDHAITGVFVVGPGYGTALPVCIARETCPTHWKAEIAAKKKTDKLRAKGQGAKADAREKKAAESAAQRATRETAERLARNAAYRQLYPLVAAAIEAALPTTLDARAFALLYPRCGGRDRRPPAVEASAYVRTLLMLAVTRYAPEGRDTAWTDRRWDRDRLLGQAKLAGVDTKPLERQVAEAMKAEAKVAAPAAAAKKAATKTSATTRKAAKKR